MSFLSVSDLIVAGLRAVQLIQGEDSPSTAEYDASLDILNVMMRSWSADYSIPDVIFSETFTLAAGSTTRTFGTGGAFNGSRPMAILKAASRLNDVSEPIEVVGRGTYKDIRLKTQVGRPVYMTYENFYPLGLCTFWPVPDVDYTVELDSQKQFGDYATISTELSINEDLHEALKYNFCIRAGAEFGVAVDEIIVGLAGQAMRRVQALYHLNCQDLPKPCSNLIV